MNSAPAVSVILPTHNRATLVGRAIDSVLGQSFEDFELIVVDDNSTDDTAQVIARFDAHPRLRYYRNAKNLGPSGARNRGIDLARGSYVAFQDSDDRWFPEKLARQMEEIREKDAQVCYCGAFYYSPENSYYIPRPRTVSKKGMQSGDLSRDILFDNPTTPQTLLVKRSLFDTVGRFDETLPIKVDWDLAIRLAQSEPFAFVAEPLVLIYRTEGSVSSDRVADAATREKLLKKYDLIFRRNFRARARQLYIVGCLHMENGEPDKAWKPLLESLRTQPGFRPLAQTIRAALLTVLRALRSSRKQGVQQSRVR